MTRPTSTPTVARRPPSLAALALAVAALGVVATAAPVAGQVGGPIGPDDPTTTTAPREEPARPDDPDDGNPGTTEGAGEDEDPETPDTTAPADGADDEGEGSSEDEPVAPESAASRDDDGVSPVGLIALVGAGFLLGAALVGGPLWIALSRRRNQPEPPAPQPAPVAPAPAPVPGHVPGTVVVPSVAELAELRTQRDGLVAALIALRDRLPSEALADEAGAALVAAGIEEVRPDGMPFDPSNHHAVGHVEDGTGGGSRVAGVERPGYRDGERTLRLPDVLVTGSEDR